MRRIYYAILIFGILMGFSTPIKSQIKYDVNIGSQPVWGPVGYDYVEYYYVPDLDIYYNVPQNRYYYYEKDRWVYNTNLPSRYSRFNLYNHYKVIVNEPEPWRKHKYYKEKYYSFRSRHDQQLIHDSRDSKYFMNKNHPEYNNWMKQKKNDNRDGDKNINNKKSNKDNNNKSNKHNSRNRSGKHKK
ncbi:MAG: hypothetical protein AUK34_10585 [Ignavibacteria bacterium CG2_30_36_16]|nr:hypothetical protein [Ignavibacteria bacterium]OIP56932.1 MAG: hypothetical protein AUK34_10585 [Ignavibacteria bacterium CG2_30_36_16]